MWTVQRHDTVVSLTYSNPPRNMMTFAAMADLLGLLGDVSADETVNVVVLGSDVPGYFVAHGDLEDLLAIGRGEEPSGPIESWGRTMSMIERMPQPVIAAIDGQAWGGGCEIAQACALRVASEAAHFSQPEIDFGIIPGAGGTVRLGRLIGFSRATELVMTGRRVDAHEALRIGLIHDVLPHDGFAERAIAWAQNIAAKPPAALRAAKAAMYFSARNDAREALREEARLFLPLQSSVETERIQRDVLARYAATPVG